MAGHAAAYNLKVPEQTNPAPLYRVLLHGDFGTLAGCAVRALQDAFYFNQRDAEEIVLEAQCKGSALCSIESLEQAERHARQLASARLTATIEPEC